MRNCLSLLFFISLVNTGFTQSIDTTRLNTYFSTLEGNNKFMGSVTISKDGERVYNWQAGFSDVATQQRPSKNTSYRIGSVSKTFTAVLVFKAIDQNKLSLSTTINRYLPTIKTARKITIADLLHHRSGLHSFTDDKEEYLSYHTQPKSKAEMVEILAKYASDFESNSKAAYSNSIMSMYRYFPEEKIAFAVTANGVNYDFNAIEATLVKSVLEKHFDIPIFSVYQPGAKELDQYPGTYSSDVYPVKLTIRKARKQLILYVLGEEPMLLEAFEKGKYKFDAAGCVLEFRPDKNEILFHQGGKTTTLKKE